MKKWQRFESSVNSEGIETGTIPVVELEEFESSVNSEGIETKRIYIYTSFLFESSVNSEGIETIGGNKICHRRLRAV